MTELATIDSFDVRRARAATGLLRDFNDAGVLAAADVHVALRLAALAGDGDGDERVALAAALAVRAPRLGHSCVDLATIRDTATVDTDEPVELSALPWPEPDAWIARLTASALVAAGEGDGMGDRPLRLIDSTLYLDRYWREERQLAADLLALGATPVDDVDAAVLADGLARLLPGAGTDDRQRQAAASAVLRRFAVVGGGPGTGKTTTVARMVALLYEQAMAADAPVPLIALAAPTGKAAARLTEAVHEEALTLVVDEAIRAQLLALGASTLHRLLGWRPDSHSRFRHDRANRLPHDVVIVDETSMVSLSLMASLAEAVRPQARLILVGDPGQLTSIEAGAVLGDIVGPADAEAGDGVVVLERVHRFGEGIARVADAIRRGDGDATLDALANAPQGVSWIDADVADRDVAVALEPVRHEVIASMRIVVEAARAGEPDRALAALAGFRLLCAHRRGPHGVATWMGRIEGWLNAAIADFGADSEWYVGRPVLVTQNDYGLRLYNGDTGVVVADGEGMQAAFERSGSVVQIRPSRLGAVDTVYAMTIHKSQGSQFDTAAVLLPPPTSRILTRELLYTAVTRARRHLILVGTPEMVRAAVERPVARASGLRNRMWGGEVGGP